MPRPQHTRPLRAEDPPVPIAASERTTLLLLVSILLAETLVSSLRLRLAMKITPEHLGRGAFVHIRQSTTDQLANNHESAPSVWPRRSGPRSRLD